MLRRFHPQRLMMLIAVGIVAAGYLLPWAELGPGPKHVNLLDHAWLRGPLVVFAVAIGGFAVLGKRPARVEGPALGTIVFLAVAIAAASAMVAYGLATSKFYEWTLQAGPFITILGAVLVVIFGLAIGRREAPSVGSALSRWNRD